MIPHPSSITTHADLQRQDLLRLAHHERLAATASGKTPSGTVIPTLGHLMTPAVRTMLVTLWPRLRIGPLRPA